MTGAAGQDSKPPSTSAARFRMGMSCLAGSVNVVALQTRDGTLMGLTATAVCSLSADPPSIIVCVNHSSALAKGLEKGAHFSVSVLSEHQTDISEAFGGRKGVSGKNRFIYGEWHRSENNVPILVDARACLECRVDDFIDYGTHRAAVGAVVDVHLQEMDDASLVFVKGSYFSIG